MNDVEIKVNVVEEQEMKPKEKTGFEAGRMREYNGIHERKCKR